MARCYSRAMHLVVSSAGALLLGSILSMAPKAPAEQDPVPAQEAKPSAPAFSVARPDALAAELERLMRAGLETRDPNHSFFGPLDGDHGGAPFDGSYDWHSSVIAHWALLIRARTTENAELESWLMERLTPAMLEHHGGLLARRAEAVAAGKEGDRRFRRAMATFPYDEGWFLMLLAERSKRDDGADLEALRAAVEERLLGALEARPFPENIGLSRRKRREGVERYCGFYGSSLILYLQLRWAGVTSKAAASRVDAWRDEVLAPRRAAIGAVAEPHGYDFLWAPAMLALGDEVDEAEMEPPYEAPAFEGWPESVKVATVHVLGMELCRVWPLAGAADPVYVERVDSLLAREELWARDFDACSHWVPQFLFIGEWLRAGRP